MESKVESDSGYAKPVKRGSRTKWLRILAVVIVLWIVALLLLVNAYPMPLSTMADFSVRTVDSTGYIRDISSACDSRDEVHLTIVSSKGLTYIAPNGDQEVLSSGQFDYCSMAVDSQSSVHIAAQLAYPDYSLLYFKYAEGQWVQQVVRAGVWGWPISIALDSQSHAYISYSTNDSLVLSSNEPGSWEHETVRLTHYGSGSVTLIDRQDRIHVLNQDPLYHYVRDNGSWIVDRIRTDYYATWISAAIDSEDAIHVGFVAGGRIIHAVNRSGSWEFTSVDNTTQSGRCSLAVDSDDAIHIAYNDYSDGTAKYAHNLHGAWSVQTLKKAWDPNDSEYVRTTAYWPTLAVDSNDNVHIIYSTHAPGDDHSTLRAVTDGTLPALYSVMLKSLAFPVIMILLVFTAMFLKNRREKNLDKHYGLQEEE